MKVKAGDRRGRATYDLNKVTFNGRVILLKSEYMVIVIFNFLRTIFTQG
jgi:hypothetical protein